LAVVLCSGDKRPAMGDAPFSIVVGYAAVKPR
jgi:hypothetical protein